MQDTQTETHDSGIMMNAQTQKFMQDKIEEKWEQERLEEERENRLFDEPIGPEKTNFDPVKELAHYNFHGIEVGDVLEWEDGEVTEVVGIVPAMQTFDEEPDGDIVHLRVLEQMDNPEEWANSREIGEKYNTRDYNVGGSLARGEVNIRSGGN